MNMSHNHLAYFDQNNGFGDLFISNIYTYSTHEHVRLFSKYWPNPILTTPLISSGAYATQALLPLTESLSADII